MGARHECIETSDFVMRTFVPPFQKKRSNAMAKLKTLARHHAVCRDAGLCT